MKLDPSLLAPVSGEAARRAGWSGNLIIENGRVRQGDYVMECHRLPENEILKLDEVSRFDGACQTLRASEARWDFAVSRWERTAYADCGGNPHEGLLLSTGFERCDVSGY